MKCKLKTITPVHIGSGENYSPSEYINSKAKLRGKKVDTIKRVDVSKLYSKLNDDEKDDYIHHLSSYSMSLDDYFKDKSKLSSDVYRYTALKKFNEQIKVNEIKENIKTLDKSYIPGSSIKGSIRTAIAYDLIEKKDIDKIYVNLRNGKYRLDKYSDKVIENLFFNDDYYKKNPSYSSLMRFLQITDSSTVNFPSVYAILTKKATERYDMVNHKKNRNIVFNFLETIPAGKTLNFDIIVNYNHDVHRQINLREKKTYFDIDTLKETIYNFSKDYIEYEQDFAYNYGFKEFQNFYNDLDSKNTKKEPLMLIGSGTGFMSKTIGMKAKKLNPSKFEEIAKTAPRSYNYEFPKSRRITTMGGKPLGWVKLITE